MAKMILVFEQPRLLDHEVDGSPKRIHVTTLPKSKLKKSSGFIMSMQTRKRKSLAATLLSQKFCSRAFATLMSMTVTAASNGRKNGNESIEKSLYSRFAV